MLVIIFLLITKFSITRADISNAVDMFYCFICTKSYTGWCLILITSFGYLNNVHLLIFHFHQSINLI